MPQFLMPGKFEVTFHATGGASRGHDVSGNLWLVALDQQVRPDGHPMYGWITADLAVVGAPMCSKNGPAPSSEDPLDPGVLVGIDAEGHHYMMVGTSGQKYGLERRTMDGCGIVLNIDNSDGVTFSGRWGPYGGPCTGCGEFQARRVSP